MAPVLIIAGLAGACDSAEPAGAGPPARLVAVSPVQLSSIVGAQASDSLTVQMTDAAGKPVRGQSVTWSVDCSGSFACSAQLSTLAGLTDAEGKTRVAVTLGTQVGQTRVVAHAPVEGGAVDVPFTITSLPAAATSITISRLTVSILKGGFHRLAASASDRFGNPVKVVWSNSAPGVVSVDSLGGVTGVELGTAFVSATAGAQVATAKVNVVVQPPYPVSIRECESHGATVCGTWTLSGNEYEASWGNTSTARITVEKFTPDSVVFLRTDLTGPTAGGTARYSAAVTGNGVRSGTVTWVHTDGTFSGTWDADW